MNRIIVALLSLLFATGAYAWPKCPDGSTSLQSETGAYVCPSDPGNNTNTNTNHNTNSNTNTNTNHNTNSNTNEQHQNQHQSQSSSNSNSNSATGIGVGYGGAGGAANSASSSNVSNSGNSTNTNSSTSQGGDARATATDINSGNNTGNGGGANVNVSGDTIKEAAHTASSTPVTVIQSDSCATGAGLGGQGLAFGVSASWTVKDEVCERLKLSRELHGRGYIEAGLEVLMQDERVRKAFEAVDARKNKKAAKSAANEYEGKTLVEVNYTAVDRGN